MTKVFVSHANADKSLVDALDDLIKSVFGSSIVLAHSSAKSDQGGVPVGADWKQWIETEIKQSDAMIVVITPDICQRSWVMTEVGFAYANKKTIIPIKFQLSKSQNIGLLKDYQFAQGNDAREITLILQKLEEILGNTSLMATQDLNYNINLYLQKVQTILTQYPKDLTQNELIAIATGPLGLAFKKGLEFLRKR